MTALAILIETRLLNQQDKLRKIMFSLCRLEAWRVRGDVGKYIAQSRYLQPISLSII